jgi:hypothetical protein
MKNLFLGSLILCLASQALAQRRYSPSDVPKMPRMSAPSGSGWKYDVSASTGKYNDATYSEINLGLSYQISDWWLWRNAAFQRFGTGSNSVTGLDTSLRLGNQIKNADGTSGLDFFIGPGYRFASNDASALFAEGGLGFKFLGIYLGVGLKSLQYVKTREDDGRELPKSDTQLFLVLGGGGAF